MENKTGTGCCKCCSNLLTGIVVLGIGFTAFQLWPRKPVLPELFPVVNPIPGVLQGATIQPQLKETNLLSLAV